MNHPNRPCKSGKKSKPVNKGVLALLCVPNISIFRIDTYFPVLTLFSCGPRVRYPIRHIISWRLGHERIFTAILPLPLIQEEQLSVTGDRMCTKYW